MEPVKFVARCRAVIVHEGTLLTVRHAGRDFLSLPGGHLEFGEDPVQCLEREIVEELGIRPVVGALLYVHTYVDTERQVQPLEFFFAVENAADYRNLEEMERTHAYEIEACEWVGPDTLMEIRPQLFANDFKAGHLFANKTRFLHGEGVDGVHM